MFRETHGGSDTPEYLVWSAMKRRCYNRNAACYARYGGRGIHVCSRWRKSFAAFREDMCPRPRGGKIDRIDNDGGYWCGKCSECVRAGRKLNCRWLRSQKEQVRNSTSVRMITARGETRSIAEWCELLDISYTRTVQRLYSGLPPEEALFSEQKQPMLIHGKKPADLASAAGVDIATIYRRHRLGWSLKDICSPPRVDGRKVWATRRANRSASAT